MAKAFRLGFVHFESPRMDEAAAYFTDVLGLQPTTNDGTETFLSIGLSDHDIGLSPGDEEGMREFGLELSAGVSLDDLAETIRAEGLPAELRSDVRPGIGRSLHVVDPSGWLVCFYESMAMLAPGPHRVGVAPQRLGHIALTSPDQARSVSFYTDVIGFATTDWFGDSATFLTGGRDHHTLNLVRTETTRFHHLALELGSADHQVSACDFLVGSGYPIVWGPSRHTAGHNIASYHRTPGGLITELYNDMDIYLPEANCFEPRPWHRERPQRPGDWDPKDITLWETEFGFNFYAGF